MLKQIVTKEHKKIEADKWSLYKSWRQVQEIERLMNQKIIETYLEQVANIYYQTVQARYQEQGLTQKRIGTWSVFTANETHVGDHCSIYLLLI